MYNHPARLIFIVNLSWFLLIVHPLWAREWQPVRGGSAYGISGIATLSQQKGIVELLVVHDNKKPDQGRVSIVKLGGNVQPQYLPLRWQEGIELPRDLEGLTAVPGKPLTYMALTSEGKVYHFSLNRTEDAIAVIKVFDLPSVPPESNLEALALTQVDGKVIAVWAHRGEGKQPALLYWGHLNLQTYQISLIGTATLKVPLDNPHVRHISDLKVDDAGVVYVTSASDSGDDGPFQSAVHVAGVVGRQGEILTFRPTLRLVPSYRDKYHKIEAIELLPGTTAGIVLGTDDESMGGSVFIAGDD
jgi:hypothetical protein